MGGGGRALPQRRARKRVDENPTSEVAEAGAAAASPAKPPGGGYPADTHAAPRRQKSVKFPPPHKIFRLRRTQWQVLGACVAAAIFSNIAKLIDKLDAAGSRYSALLDSINEFGKFYRLPAQTRAKLHGYCAFLFAVNRGIDTNEVMSTLPPALQTEVLYTMHQHLVRQVPMFADTDDLFIKALVRVLKPQARRRRASRAEREGGREREQERAV